MPGATAVTKLSRVKKPKWSRAIALGSVIRFGTNSISPHSGLHFARGLPHATMPFPNILQIFDMYHP